MSSICICTCMQETYREGYDDEKSTCEVKGITTKKNRSLGCANDRLIREDGEIATICLTARKPNSCS